MARNSRAVGKSDPDRDQIGSTSCTAMKVHYDRGRAARLGRVINRRLGRAMKSRAMRGLAVLAGLGLRCLFQQRLFAADRISVALNWVPAGDHAAMYYAKKLG